MQNVRHLLPLSAAVLLSACSTLPTAVHESAEETGAWIGQLQTELSRFRRDQDVADKVLLEAIKGSQKTEATLSASHSEILRVAQAAGDTRTLDLVKHLKTVIDGAATDPSDLELKLKEIDERLAGLLTPTPAIDLAFTQARSSVRLLGQPLPDSIQFNELKTFFKKVKEDTDANRKQLP